MIRICEKAGLKLRHSPEDEMVIGELAF